MKRFMRMFATTVCVISVFYLQIPCMNAKLYGTFERANLSCHYAKDMNSLANSTILEEIDKYLDDLYGLIRTNGSYEEECHVEVSYEFSYLEGNSSSESTGAKMINETVTEDLAVLLEGFEIKRARYAQGLWGYCAKEGAEELIANISALMEVAKSENVTLCNRDELLYCHPKYSRCLCMVDNINFREVASEYWNDTEEMEESGKTLGKNQCTLIIGSDCPINRGTPSNNETNRFICRPDSRCLFKENKKPCDLNDNNTTGRMKETADTIPESRYKRDAEQNDQESVDIGKNDTANSTDMQTTHSILTYKEEVSDDLQARSVDTTGPRKYRYIRNDYPNIHCQCYGYIGGHSGGLGHVGLIEPSLWLQLQFVIHFALNFLAF